MEKYEVYRSENGYRVAAEMVNGGPVISRGLGAKWFEAYKAASCAAMAAWNKDASAPVYVVSNVYGISGQSRHMTPVAAFKERNRREVDGWIVKDGDGNIWDIYDGKPVKL